MHLLVECRELVMSVAGKTARERDSVGDLEVLTFLFMLLIFNSVFNSSYCVA